ncbi:hypothetical protein LJC17_05025 [Acholeplasma sp. OttesenSCG-928-E16]|nr:hypothetical protein [Acholeplasma sp. OttesenSCG-928-E16]
MRDKRKYSEMNKGELAFRLINISFSIIMSLTCFIYFLILIITKEDPTNRKWTTIGMTLLCLIPVVLEFIVKYRLSNMIYLFFNIFVFAAGFTGSVLYVYDKWPDYDKLIHFVFGYVGGIIGMILICKLSDYDSLKPLFICLVCFLVSMGCGALWECFEYLADNLMGQTSQGVPIEIPGGGTIVSLADTIEDLYANLFGAVLFSIHFVLHRITGKNLLMGSIIDDFKRDFQ